MLALPERKLSYMSTLASRITQARKAAKFSTLTAFAAALDKLLKRWGFHGVTRAACAQWESGDTKSVRPENLAAISHVTGHRMEWLATGRLPRVVSSDSAALVAAEPEAPAYVGDDALEVARLWASLPSPTREMVRQFIYLQTLLADVDPRLAARPAGSSYVDFEQRVVSDMRARIMRKAK